MQEMRKTATFHTSIHIYIYIYAVAHRLQEECDKLLYQKKPQRQVAIEFKSRSLEMRVPCECPYGSEQVCGLRAEL